LFPLLIGETRAILAHSRTGRFLREADMEKTAPRLLFPQLGGFYARVEPLAVALRGGGPYSLDRVIGKEL